MMPTTAVLFAASLLAQVRGTTSMADMLKEHETSSSIELKNKFDKPVGAVSIQLSENKWQLYYQYPDSQEKDLLRHNKELEQKSPLVAPQEDESLEAYAARVATQKSDITTFVQNQIVNNINNGSISTAGFGAAECVCKELYSNNNRKWRMGAGAWNNLLDQFENKSKGNNQ